MSLLDRCHNIADLRGGARRRLPKGVFEFVDRGSEDEIALRDNRAAFGRLKLRTRFLVDLTGRDMGTDLFGKRSELPLAIAPTGIAGLLCYQGELALARAAAAAGVPFTLTSNSITSIDAIARGSDGRLWYQVYMWKDQQPVYDMIARARDMKRFDALVVTIDTALGRNREHNLRNGFGIPFTLNPRVMADMALHPGWLMRVMLPYLSTTGLPKHENFPPQYQRVIARGIGGGAGGGEPSRHEGMTWQDIKRLRDFWPGKLIVKGILSGHDAKQAADHGADGIVVSNHGGRALDSAVPTIDILPEVVAAVGGRVTILLDSGIRRGSDIVKALALGAQGVLVGRATLYGIAVAGEKGAAKALAMLRSEFEKTMGYVGCRRVAELGRDIFAPGPN